MLLDAFGALLKSDQAAADKILGELGGDGPVERDIVSELASHQPLRAPARFDQAHRPVMKSLEVLKRNGSRPPKLPRNPGPLNPAAKWVIQLFTRLIVQR